MPSKLGNRFHHKHNKNGTHESVCGMCFMTVTTVSEESELSHFEDAHICDPVRVYEVRECTRHALLALNLDFGKPQPQPHGVRQ